MPRPSASDSQHGSDHSDSGGSEALSPTLTVLEGVGGTGDYYQHVSGAGDRHTLQVRFEMPFHPETQLSNLGGLYKGRPPIFGLFRPPSPLVHFPSTLG